MFSKLPKGMLGSAGRSVTPLSRLLGPKETTLTGTCYVSLIFPFTFKPPDQFQCNMIEVKEASTSFMKINAE